MSRKEVWVRFLLACHRTHPELAAGVQAAVEAECARSKLPPLVSVDEMDQCIKQLEGTPLVDVQRGYKPVELPIKLN